MLKQFCQRQAGRLRLSTMSCILHGFGASIAALILMAGSMGHHTLFCRHQILQRDYVAAVDLSTQANAIHAASANTRDLLNAAKVRQQQVHSQIPPQPNEIAFLDLLSASAARTGLQIRDYRPGAHSEFDTHHEMELSLRAEGDYESLCHFVANLESLPRMCRITSLSVVGSQPGKTDMTIEIKIALVHGLKTHVTI